jgi:hypothetical protein
LGINGLAFPLLIGGHSGINGEPQGGLSDFRHIGEEN